MKKFSWEIMMLNKIILLGAALLLIGCGSSNSSSGNSNNATTNNTADLIINAPNILPSIPSGITSVNYLIIDNPTDHAITGINYSLSSLIGGASGVLINQQSTKQCLNIAAHSSCTLEINAPAKLTAGSFALNLNNNSNVVSTIKSASIINADSVSIGVEPIHYNSTVGADGVKLYYYDQIIAGTKYVIITGVVTSNKVGNFNYARLLDLDGIPIAQQKILSANLGAGLTDLAQGSSFTIVIPAPSGTGMTQQFVLQLSELSPDQQQLNLETSTSSYTIEAVSQQAIINFFPQQMDLTTENPAQILTFYNTGDTTAQLNNFSVNNDNVVTIFSASSLNVNKTLNTSVKLKDSTQAGSYNTGILNYNNTKTDIAKSIVISANDTNVNPSLSADLSITLTPDNNFFTTTNDATVSRQLNIKNPTDSIVKNFVFTLAKDFSLSKGNDNSCNLVENTVTNSLNPAASCNLTLTYNNQIVAASNVATINISYDFNNSINNIANLIVNYRVTQASANLSITPINQDFGTYLNNNSDKSPIYNFTVINNGDESAKNLIISLTGSNNNLFHLVDPTTGNGCNSVLLHDQSCTIGVEFGPSADPAGVLNAKLNLSYQPFVNSANTIISSNLTGTLRIPNSALIKISTLNFLGTDAGTGELNNPLQIVQNSNSGVVTVIYQNDGPAIAYNFNTNIDSSLTNSLMTQGCKNIDLSANGGSCSDSYQLNTTNTGLTTLDFNKIYSNWSDESSSYTNKIIMLANNYSDNKIYSNIYTAPTITVNPNQITQIIQGDGTLVGPRTDHFSFSINLAGGYQVKNQTITIANLADFPINQFVVSSVPNPCVLQSNTNPNNTSCTFTFNALWYPRLVAESYNLNLNNDGGLNLNLNRINFNVAPAATVYLAQTGQNATAPVNPAPTGSDGTLMTGIKLSDTRFMVGNGIESSCIIDQATGLMWARDANLFVESQLYSDAVNLITTMNNSINKLCGYSDWRLPNINQLSSLINFNQESQLIWLSNQNFINIQIYGYWSATLYSNSSNVWVLNFFNGNTLTQDSAKKNYIWPMRYSNNIKMISSLAQTGESDDFNGIAWPNPRFIIGSGVESACIIDQLTGLMWSKNSNILSPSGFGYDWITALNTVNKMNTLNGATAFKLCGYNDWRLPNVNELASLVNYSQGANQWVWLRKQGFNNIGTAYWTSSISPNNINSAYYTSTTDGGRYTGPIKSSANAWPVRGGN